MGRAASGITPAILSAFDADSNRDGAEIKALLLNADEFAEGVDFKSVRRVVLLDIALPGRDGLEVLQQMRLEWPLLPVLVLSTYREKQYGLRCLRLGAGGYLNKSVDPDTLASAIRKLHAGGSYVSAALAETLATALRRHD